jgi:hypothetical protein
MPGRCQWHSPYAHAAAPIEDGRQKRACLFFPVHICHHLLLLLPLLPCAATAAATAGSSATPNSSGSSCPALPCMLILHTRLLSVGSKLISTTGTPLRCSSSSRYHGQRVKIACYWCLHSGHKQQ